MTYISLKVLILGSENVGELNFRRIVDRYFKTDYKKIVGVNVLSKEISVEIDNNQINTLVSLWDISTKIRFEEIRKLFYTGGTGAFFVFDLNKPQTWYHIIEFYKEIDFVLEKIPFVVVGNLDKGKEITVNPQDIKQWVKNHNGTFIQIDTDNLSLLEDTFLNLVKKIVMQPS